MSTAPRLTIPITAFLVLGFGGLMLIALATQFYLGLTAARENTIELLGDKAHATLEGIVSQIRSTMDPVASRGRAVARLVAGGELVLGDPHFDAFLLGTLASSPNLQSIAVLSPNLSLRSYQRDPLSTAETDASDNAEMERLVESSKTIGRASWATPRAARGQSVTQNRIALFDHLGRFVGVLIQDVRLSVLSGAIGRLARSGEPQTPFILDGSGAVLAHPLLIQGNLQVSEWDDRLPAAEELGDAILAGIWSPDEIAPLRVTAHPGETVKGLSFGDRVFLFVYRSVEFYAPRPWTVGTYFDGARTRTQVRRLALAGAGGGAILIAFLVLAFFFGRRASRPARLLARAAVTVRQGELDAVEHLQPSRIRELDAASSAFNEMVEGLRERETIRDLFGKFVPRSVATEMLRTPGGLEPQSCEATILFVDLEGFTSLAEKTDPLTVVEILNEYFTALVSTIEAHGGIITQFQGDAILAVFNVPRPLEDHEKRAVEAARSIRKVVAEETFGGNRLRCRIGVNTGSVVAGNVGANGRMNYTVHGDAVNLAARLEQLNKEYGTEILVSDTTASRVKAEGLRKLAVVQVRGRSQPVTLYTL